MTVKIYSTSTCPICKSAKEYMRNNKIKFSDVDVSESEAGLKEMVEKSGQNSVPVFEIDEKVFVGFSDTVKKRLNDKR